MKSTLRPPSVKFFSFRYVRTPCSIRMPPAASGPVLTVSRPSLNGFVCATAGAGKPANVAAAPAAALPSSPRRDRLRDIVHPPINHHAPRKRSMRQSRSPSVRHPRIFSDSQTWMTTRASALGQRRIIARIDRVREEVLLGPGPELADVFVGVNRLVPELQPVFGAFGADAADVEIADHVVEVIELDRPARRVGEADRLKRRHEFLLVAGIAAGGLEP